MQWVGIGVALFCLAVLGVAGGSVWLVGGSLGILLASVEILIGAVVVARYIRLQREYAELQHLYTFGQRIGDLLEVDRVVHAVLAETSRLLRAERALFVVVDEELIPGGRRYRLSNGNPGLEIDDQPPDLDGWRQAVSGPRAARLTGDGGELAATFAELGLREALAVQVTDGDAVTGLLVAADPISGRFARDDAEFFDALLVQLRSVLRNALLFGRLSQQALHDPLTGLGNRSHFMRRVAPELAEVEPDHPLVVLMIDLNRFKEVNDTLGHHVGDDLLVEVGERLRTAMRAGDPIARFGGDEFAVAFRITSGDPETVTARRLDDVARSLRGPYEIQGLQVDSSGSIGAALAPQDGTDLEELLQRADLAMYQAKRAGGGWLRYDAEMETENARGVALAADLREAIEREQLTVTYQPQIDVATGGIAGVEALVRWTHPSDGEIAPDEFITVAEKSGLIQRLSNLVMRIALGQAREWKLGGRSLPVTVNLSPMDVDRELAGRIHHLLDEFGLDPDDIVLEMTESAIMRDLAVTESILRELAGIGVAVALDDFGSGQPSLVQLSRLPLQALKIDRAFVAGMESDDRHATVVRTTIELGHSLGMKVIAVGIESEPVRDLLVQQGTDVLQGFLFCRPLPAEEIGPWLDAHPDGSFGLDGRPVRSIGRRPPRRVGFPHR